MPSEHVQMTSEQVAQLTGETILSPEKIGKRAKIRETNQRGLEGKREGIRFAMKMFDLYTNNLLGSETNEISEMYGDTPLDEREEAEQADLFFQLHSLVAEQRDLVQTLRVHKGKEQKQEQPQAFTIKVVGGRRVKIPVRSLQSTESLKSAAVLQAEKRLEEVRSSLQDLGRVPGIRKAYKRKMLETYRDMKLAAAFEQLKNRNAELKAQIEELRSGALKGPTGVVRGLEREQLELLEKEYKENQEKITMAEQHELGHRILRLLQLREYADAIAKGRMVEIPTIKKLVDASLEHMRNGQPVLFVGHLGAGKTEAARHAARLFMMENGIGYDPNKTQDEWYDSLEPEFFSGSEEASVYDLVGKLKLVGKSSSDPDVLQKHVKELSEALQQVRITDVPESRIAELLLGKGDVTETIFQYGPLGRALKRGVPLIVDEITRMPAESSSRLNDIILRGIGTQIYLQENGEAPLERKPGFAVLATGNLGRQYAGLKEQDAAFKSRFVPMEVFYPTMEETYDLALASLLRKDRIRLPPDFPADQLEKMVDLTVAVREIQEIFSGRTEGQRFMAMTTGVLAEKSQLDKAVVSTRDLMRKIILPWKKSGFRISLDEIIAKNILAAEVFSMDDQKFMTEIFIRRGFFLEWAKVSKKAPEQVEEVVKTPEVSEETSEGESVKEAEDTEEVQPIEPADKEEIVPSPEEETEEEMKEVPWSAKRFEEMGIRSISQKEIDVLCAQMQTPEYKQANSVFDTLREQGEKQAALIRADLLIGTKTRAS